MTLSWNEIKDRALNFSKEWAGTTNEDADAKSFLDAFFDVFGISRKKIGTFEKRVKKLSDADGYIDLLWKGTILVEMKSRGKNLDKAFQQAIDYTHGLKQNELPKYVLVCDFHFFRLYDTEEQITLEFTIDELVLNVQSFGYLLGYQKITYKEQDPANIKAAELMGKLHDRLEEIGYTGHPLEVYLVRILFLLFAEDTTIFNKQQFQDFLEQRTAEDGSDLASKLQELFQVLNTAKENRFKNLDEQLADFPYVNGKLFEEILPTASFDTKMRQALLDCCYIDWSKISPAIFGSMFQSVMNPKERRNLGAHYTSESNIQKLIKPLFLDELRAEFENVKHNKNKLSEFHQKISALKFLDPACGCGNFLVITYRELRLLELDILRALHKNQLVIDIRDIIKLDVDMMYGIEYEEFPARIAQVAMWLIDHQMNMQISIEFGHYFARLPLIKSANIVHGNALRIDWESLVPKNELSFIIGNPPFIGYKLQNQTQKDDLIIVFKDNVIAKNLDYVAAWYIVAAKFVKNTKCKCAFVSTNSIVQGEQVPILWKYMIEKIGVKINFAHQTFSWSNEAKGNAAVHVVIIGFANYDSPIKRIFEYENIKGEAHEIKAKNINGYLIDAKNVFIEKRNNPLQSFVPKMNYGSEPREGGFLLLSTEEKASAISKEPNIEKFIKRFVSSDDFINNNFRYCLWLVDAEPTEIKNSTFIKERLENVRKFRSQSLQKAANASQEIPAMFTSIRQPTSNYLLVPIVSSSNRKYIPIGFVNKEVIVSNASFSVENASLFHFGIIVSTMHLAWLKSVCGRLKSDFRYSNTIVYNNYPWPENPSDKQVKAIEIGAQKVLDTRLEFPNSSLADLYDPLTMPPALVKAHNELDKAVDLAYRPQAFTSEANRMVFLFELYEKYTADLFTKEKPKKTNKKKES